MINVKRSANINSGKNEVLNEIKKGQRIGFNCLIDKKLKKILDQYLTAQDPRMRQYQWVEQKIREQFNLD